MARRRPAVLGYPEQPHRALPALARRSRDHHVPQSHRERQRPDTRPRREPDRLRALDAPRVARRRERQRGDAGRCVRGQAAQLAQRRRGAIRRQGLLYRSALRPAQPVRGQGAAAQRRLPHRSRRLRAPARGRLRAAQRPGLLARRKDAVRRRFAALAHPRLRRRMPTARSQAAACSPSSKASPTNAASPTA